MSRYPRSVRNARLKCISCNAPVVETIDETYHCVDCGASPIQPDDGGADGTGTDAADGTGTDATDASTWTVASDGGDD